MTPYSLYMHLLSVWVFNSPPPPSPPPTNVDTRLPGTKLSWGWRTAPAVTLPVALRWSWWPLGCRAPPGMYVGGTKFFVRVTSLLFVRAPIVAKTKDAVSVGHKGKLFLWAPELGASVPSLNRLVTPVTAGQRGQDQRHYRRSCKVSLEAEQLANTDSNQCREGSFTRGNPL